MGVPGDLVLEGCQETLKDVLAKAKFVGRGGLCWLSLVTLSLITDKLNCFKY